LCDFAGIAEDFSFCIGDIFLLVVNGLVAFTHKWIAGFLPVLSSFDKLRMTDYLTD
jgi:hypothetical protein